MVFQLNYFDQGHDFERELTANLCQLAAVQKIKIIPYPGHCECHNSTILNMLGTLSPEQKKDWNAYVSTLVNAHNCTMSAATIYNLYC